MVHLWNREREKIIPLQQNEVLLPTATLMFTSIDARRSLCRIEISRKIMFEFRTSGEQRVDMTMECSKFEKMLLFFHPYDNNNNNNNNKQHRDTSQNQRSKDRFWGTSRKIPFHRLILPMLVAPLCNKPCKCNRSL